MEKDCILCERQQDERIVLMREKWRVIFPDEAGYPGFCRVIWNAHVAEMTDLPEPDRMELMEVVFSVEKAVREIMRPDKVNLASLGNRVPHLHWHIIPRFEDDAHFPESVWGKEQRKPAPAVMESRRIRLPELEQAILRMSR